MDPPLGGYSPTSPPPHTHIPVAQRTGSSHKLAPNASIEIHTILEASIGKLHKAIPRQWLLQNFDGWSELYLKTSLCAAYGPLTELHGLRTRLECGWSQVVRLLASKLGEPGSIPSEVAPGFSHVEIMSDDGTGRRVFSGISRFPRPFIAALLHTDLASPSADLETAKRPRIPRTPQPHLSTKCRNAVRHSKPAVVPASREPLAARNSQSDIRPVPSALRNKQGNGNAHNATPFRLCALVYSVLAQQWSRGCWWNQQAYQDGELFPLPLLYILFSQSLVPAGRAGRRLSPGLWHGAVSGRGCNWLNEDQSRGLLSEGGQLPLDRGTASSPQRASPSSPLLPRLTSSTPLALGDANFLQRKQVSPITKPHTDVIWLLIRVRGRVGVMWSIYAPPNEAHFTHSGQSTGRTVPVCCLHTMTKFIRVVACVLHVSRALVVHRLPWIDAEKLLRSLCYIGEVPDPIRSGAEQVLFARGGHKAIAVGQCVYSRYLTPVFSTIPSLHSHRRLRSQPSDVTQWLSFVFAFRRTWVRIPVRPTSMVPINYSGRLLGWIPTLSLQVEQWRPYWFYRHKVCQIDTQGPGSGVRPSHQPSWFRQPSCPPYCIQRKGNVKCNAKVCYCVRSLSLHVMKTRAKDDPRECVMPIAHP
ncbi:hypothetical protein PR048_028230 [Dryococelus australis]|uniref:Uncharacterized protein n=1 Tax=Dryococelus australis TaxID=614101 RepID=A0ABQ9GIN7_9NEOP|nr:hypothetical protein PR048_028230 [Dryococelus australis]